MKSKTLQLISQTYRLLKEQGEDPNAMPPDAQGAPQPEGDAPMPETPAEPEETMPLTSQAEEKYIKDLIDAALFEPSAEQANVLLNLQSVMQLKRYKNAREEILPTILGIIAPETDANDLGDTLGGIDNMKI
jgi:hypothetical protein